MREITAKGKGPNWLRSLTAARGRVDDETRYFIRRNGAYFRPKAAGYTNHLASAGIYTGKEARRYLDAQGVALIPINAMAKELRAEADGYRGQIETLMTLVQQIEAA